MRRVNAGMIASGALVRLNCVAGTAYYLRVSCRTKILPFIRVWKNNPTLAPVFIPAASETEFLIKSSEDIVLLFLEEEVNIRAWRHWSLTDNVKRVRFFRFDKIIRFDDRIISVQPILRLADNGLDIARTIRTLTEWGFGTSTASLQDTLLYEHLNHLDTQPSHSPIRFPSIATVVHLHYEEVWPDFDGRLGRISLPFTLIVTTNKESPELAKRIRFRFPDAKIVVYPNRGRDVGPFIQLLRDGYLDGYDLVCKVHGKRSVSLGVRAAFGEIWRCSMLNDLLGSDALVQAIVNRFVIEPDLGLIGPARFRLPNQYRHAYKDTWGTNENLTRDLAKKLGCSKESLKLDFFAGTMFWIRRELLDFLKLLDLSVDSFPNEEGQSDGTLQHALERLFGVLPSCAIPKMRTGEMSWQRPVAMGPERVKSH